LPQLWQENSDKRDDRKIMKCTPFLIEKLYPRLGRIIKEMRDEGDKFPNLGEAIRRLNNRKKVKSVEVYKDKRGD